MHILGEMSGSNLLAHCMANQDVSFQVEPVVDGIWYKLLSDNDPFIYSTDAAEPRHIHAQLHSVVGSPCIQQKIVAVNDAALKLIRSFLIEDRPPH